MNPSHGASESVRIEARIEDGVVLPGRAWVCDQPRARIVLAHGLSEHSGRYAALAGDLVGAGYTVVSLDWPGHGEAGGRRGDVRSWIWLRDHAVPAGFAAAQALPHQPEKLPHILLGHSMGGLLALDYALAHPHSIAGVVASAPALRSETPPAWKLALARIARVVTPSIGFPIGLSSIGISRDPEVVRARNEDTLVHDVISPRLYFGLTEARERVLRDASRLAIPALVMQGTADSIADPAGTKAFCASAPKDRLECVFYEGAYHEIFNDLGREVCVRDLLGWLSRVVR